MGMVRILQGVEGMSKHPRDGITAAEWTATSPAVQRIGARGAAAGDAPGATRARAGGTGAADLHAPRPSRCRRTPQARHRAVRRGVQRGATGACGLWVRCCRRRTSTESWTRQVYDRYRYDTVIDYIEEPPAPPLREADVAWGRERIAAWRQGRAG